MFYEAERHHFLRLLREVEDPIDEESGPEEDNVGKRTEKRIPSKKETSKLLRLDDKITRNEKKSEDKLAPIRQLFATIDEKLPAFRDVLRGGTGSFLRLLREVEKEGKDLIDEESGPEENNVGKRTEKRITSKKETSKWNVLNVR
ncbi:hypothetical protein ILUMI_07421 [Ignelater luminosus]|uniref:Uncharacterized protein n=1 Tax=Ignelater luminosus TaxID=2038154 RepID=A0A8K0GGC7_IGNLU|nr:hypothetical protein ILUMI_07421 [Ignelater luminosus]